MLSRGLQAESNEAFQKVFEYMFKQGSLGWLHHGSLQIHGVTAGIQTWSQTWGWRPSVELCTFSVSCSVLSQGNAWQADSPPVFLRTRCVPSAGLPVWCQLASSCCEGTSLMVPETDAAVATGVLLWDVPVVELRLAGKTESLSHWYAVWPSWSARKFLKMPPEHVFIFYCFWRDKYSKSLMPEKKSLWLL